MKKLMVSLSAFALLLVAIPVFAANTGAGAQGTSSQQGNATQTQPRSISPSPAGSTVQNQNQVQTQNQGVTTQIQTNTQESQGEEQDIQEQGTPKETSSRSETAKENMSNVASKVEELLTTNNTQGGIGTQVKQIAQEQKIAQQDMAVQLGKVDGRGVLLRSIIGPDFQALKNMQKVMEQNQLRIQQLTQLQNQLMNQSEITQVQDMIQALTNQNTVLQDRINLEEQMGSLLGWLFKLFAK